MPRRLAVVDIGSNTLKFSITEVQDSRQDHVLHAHAETVRLGAGVAIRGMIDPARSERALDALRHYELIAKSFGVEACIGVATAALRMAANGDDLLDQIHRKTGWSIRVITGEEEARLAFRGLADLLPAHQGSLLVDIGGGSTELISVANRTLVASESLRIGSGTLADRCFASDPPGLPVVREAVDAAAETLLGSLVLPAVTSPAIVLSGGNGQFLKAFAGWSEVNVPFVPDRFRDVLASLAAFESVRVAAYLDIVPERARMLPAGAAIAMAVIESARPGSIDAAPSGIRGGLVAEWIAAHP